MRPIVRDLALAAFASFLLVLPLLVLELTNNPLSPGDLSDLGMLFGVLWLLPLAALTLLMPLVRRVFAGGPNLLHPAVLVVRLTLAIGLSALWVFGVMDQMPCFLGVPNCD